MHDHMISVPKAEFHSKFFCAFLQIADENGLSIAAPFCITDEAQPGDGMWLSKKGSREVLQLKMDIVTMIHSEALRRRAERCQSPKSRLKTHSRFLPLKRSSTREFRAVQKSRFLHLESEPMKSIGYAVQRSGA
jgi:hypothetical protein